MNHKELLRALFVGSLSLSTLVGCKKTISEEPKEKEQTKEDVIEKEDTTVYEITVDDIVNNSSYQNKNVKVKGYIPNKLYYDDEGNMVIRLYNEEESEYVVVTEEFPTAFYCLVYVYGTIQMQDGEVVLEASEYEVIEQYQDEQPEYDPDDNYGACVYGPPEYFE